mmetsp:Transcript_6970/g.16789  ORF Transcript_6970/g.16789 Transcript_6970/m.16789 type:complete len:307 (+) Transcript_6970:575-1495(+)
MSTKETNGRFPTIIPVSCPRALTLLLLSRRKKSKTCSTFGTMRWPLVTLRWSQRDMQPRVSCCPPSPMSLVTTRPRSPTTSMPSSKSSLKEKSSNLLSPLEPTGAKMLVFTSSPSEPLVTRSRPDTLSSTCTKKDNGKLPTTTPVKCLKRSLPLRSLSPRRKSKNSSESGTLLWPLWTPTKLLPDTPARQLHACCLPSLTSLVPTTIPSRATSLISAKRSLKEKSWNLTSPSDTTTAWMMVSMNSPWEPLAIRSRPDTRLSTHTKMENGRLPTTTPVRCLKKLSLRLPSLNWLAPNKQMTASSLTA